MSQIYFNDKSIIEGGEELERVYTDIKLVFYCFRYLQNSYMNRENLQTAVTAVKKLKQIVQELEKIRDRADMDDRLFLTVHVEKLSQAVNDVTPDV